MALELPLFPNYLFLHIPWEERIRVLDVPGIISIVGSQPESSSVPETYIEALRGALQLGKIEPHPYLSAGEKVRIKNGAMQGMEGVLVRWKSGLRVVLTLDMIMRSVAVELDAGDVEPVVMPRQRQ